jgi:nicotinamide-nucleotide amidase
VDEKGKHRFISLPECRMKWSIENEKSFKGCEEYERPYIIHKTILTYGQGSLISERIEAWENSLPQFWNWLTCQVGKVRLRIRLEGNNYKWL